MVAIGFIFLPLERREKVHLFTYFHRLAFSVGGVAKSGWLGTMIAFGLRERGSY